MYILKISCDVNRVKLGGIEDIVAIPKCRACFRLSISGFLETRGNTSDKLSTGISERSMIQSSLTMELMPKSKFGKNDGKPW